MGKIFAIRNNLEVNGSVHKRETLWEFLQEKSTVKLVFDEQVIQDPNNEDSVVGTGVLVICVGLNFPKEDLKEFEELFFEVFPLE